MRGAYPDMLLWVHRYGPRGEAASGAVLIDQPAEIFDHRYADAIEMAAGGWALDLPLWTDQESPSELTASVTVAVDGTVTVGDVRVH